MAFCPLFPGRIDIWKCCFFVEGGKPENPVKNQRRRTGREPRKISHFVHIIRALRFLKCITFRNSYSSSLRYNQVLYFLTFQQTVLVIRAMLFVFQSVSRVRRNSAIFVSCVNQTNIVPVLIGIRRKTSKRH